MKFIAVIVAIFAWSALVFGAGILFHEHQLLSSPYVSTESLVLAGQGNGDSGSLPSGTTLYSYGGPDEQPMFIVFVGTKELRSLAPTTSDHWFEISPVVASSTSKIK